MAKVRQLSGAFGQRNTAVTRGAIDVSGLAGGLKSASESYAMAQQISNQYDVQLAQAEANNANWQALDWRNNFLVNMDSPQKLKEYFTGTPFESVVSSVNDPKQLTDSSYAQTLYFGAIDIAAKNISDESYRNQWITNKRIEWETIEPEYQAGANAIYQGEARKLEMSNLNSMWKAGVPTEDPAFRGQLDNMYAMGLIDLQQGEELLLNYQKAEQTQFIESQFSAALMPRDENGDGIFEMYASEEAMNIALNSATLVADGKANFLSDEEINDLRDKWITKSLNYTALSDQYRTQGREEYYGMQWQEVNSIIESTSISDADRAAVAQNKIDQLIMMQGKEMPAYQTGHPELPSVARGMQDTDEINRLIGKLSSVVVGAGKEGASTTEAVSQARRIVNDPSMSPSMKANAIDTMYRNNELSRVDFKDYTGDIDSQSTQLHNRIRTDLQNSIEVEGWSTQQVNDLDSRLISFFRDSGGLSNTEIEAGARNIIADFATDNSRVMELIDDWQENAGNMWNQAFRNRAGFSLTGDNVSITSDMMRFQDDIERGNFAGLVTVQPDMFAEYAAAQDLGFKQAWGAGRVDYSGPEIMFEGENPRVVATVTDPYGNALIAVPLTDQSRREPGTAEVRIFQPMLERRGASNYKDGELTGARRRMQYVEVTDHENYFITTFDANGNQADPYVNGEFNFLAERSILSSNGGVVETGGGLAKLLQVVSVDPNAIMSRQER